MTVSSPPNRGLESGETPPPNQNQQQQQQQTQNAADDDPGENHPQERDQEPQQPETPPDPETLIQAYPLAKLQKLEELISNPRWVIPVLPKGELEVLLDASIGKQNIRFLRSNLSLTS